jgi:hypothetical protein
VSISTYSLHPEGFPLRDHPRYLAANSYPAFVLAALNALVVVFVGGGVVGQSAGVTCAVHCKAVSLSFAVLLPLLELESHPGSKCARHWNVSVGYNMRCRPVPRKLW